jgi:uncharacterized protein HemY
MKIILGFAPIEWALERRPQRLPRRGIVLRDALLAIFEGRWDEAERTITSEGDPDDARLLNLLGVVCQARREWKAARRFYGRAMKADRKYAPAEQNMRRLYELHTFGRTALPIALIDLTGADEEESRIAITVMRE